MLLALAGSPPAGAADGALDPAWLDVIELRNLGPFRAGSWITDIAVPEGDDLEHRYTFFVAARHGGVWKTTNAGTTFRNVTDDYGISAVGDIALAPSDPRVLWVGTGDAEVTRSSHSGSGVYRSTDGGQTFVHVGLAESHHVARIVVHPRDPDTAWVASMGALFTASAQRGVFLTRDGGATWQHVLDLGASVGVIDLVVRPDAPEVLYAAAYEKRRHPWTFEAGGPGSALYRSRDGGSTWERLQGGLPSGDLGRIGVDLCRTQPHTLYAVVENLALRAPTEGEAMQDRDAGRQPRQRPVGNEVYRSDDGGDTWRRTSPEGVAVGSKSAYAFNEVRVDPLDPEKVYVTSETLWSSVDGGVTWRDSSWPPQTLFAKMFGDVRTLWIDPRDPRRMLLGSDGGVFPTFDGGVTTDHLPHLPLGEIYAVAADLADPYHLYLGLQDHEAWRGPVDSWSGSVTLEDWVIVGKWDGMVSQVDPAGRWYYGTTQFGNHVRADLREGRRVDIMPRAPAGAARYRYTWVTPLQLSPHDDRVLYTGAQMVLRSTDRGDTWREISPDLTTNDPARIDGEGHVQFCTITTLAESPLRAGLLWVGTDDGRLWTSTDFGGTWTERTSELERAGAPPGTWVSRVAPSHHDERRVYVTLSGYTRDDFAPYVYGSDDGGASWTSLAAGLPASPVNVVVEDRRNPELLFVGNDRGVWLTLDRGATWTQLPADLPPVPVKDLLIHPREDDLIVGTYGRGAWVGDVHPLQELRAEVRAKRAHLFRVEPRPVQLTERAGWGDYRLYGDRTLATPNRPDGLEAFYWLREPAGEVKVVFRRPGGGGVDAAVLAERSGGTGVGLHRLVWRTRLGAEDPTAPPTSEEAVPAPSTADVEPSEPSAVGADHDRRDAVLPGEVEVVLIVDGEAAGAVRTRLREMPAMPLQP